MEWNGNLYCIFSEMLLLYVYGDFCSLCSADYVTRPGLEPYIHGVTTQFTSQFCEDTITIPSALNCRITAAREAGPGIHLYGMMT